MHEGGDYHRTAGRSLLLNPALQTICNFILQSGSLITFSNNSPLQSVLKIELMNAAIKIVQFKIRLQDDRNYESNSNQVREPKENTLAEFFLTLRCHFEISKREIIKKEGIKIVKKIVEPLCKSKHIAHLRNYIFDSTQLLLCE